MTIEQEFFEAFGIEPNTTFTYHFVLKNNPKYYTNSKYVVMDLCEQGYKVSSIEITKYYPPITPEIVLHLIKILLDCDIDILMAKDENGYIARKNIMSYSMHWVVDENFNNTVLKLCIQLKDEIQDQVKALFNK